MNQRWKDAAELAAHFKIKVPTVRKLMREGLPHLRVGRLVRFDLDRVEQWFDERQTKSHKN